MSRLLAHRMPTTSGRTKITKCLGVLGGRPAEQQPGHPPRRSGGNHRLAARHAGPPCLQEQAVPLAGPRRIVLHSLRDVLVDDHDRSPRQRLSLPLRSALALTLTEHESCSEIHPQHWPERLDRGVRAAGHRLGAPLRGSPDRANVSSRGTSWRLPEPDFHDYSRVAR